MSAASLKAIRSELGGLRAELTTLTDLVKRAVTVPVEVKPAREPLGMTTAEAIAELSFDSETAFREFAKSVGLVPYRRGWYRRDDVLAAPGKAMLLKRHAKRGGKA